MSSEQTFPTFDYLFILDFEAHCEIKSNTWEIIEFPTLCYNTKTQQVESTFHYYVKPTKYPQLNAKCIEITGITQELLDKYALSFTKVLSEHVNWFESTLQKLKESNQRDVSFCYITCGDWDLQKMLPTQCKVESKSVPWFMKKWINLKIDFMNEYKLKREQGMAGMLRHLQLSLDGHHHSGIDDTKNLSKIISKMILDGYRFTTKSIRDYSSTPHKL